MDPPEPGTWIPTQRTSPQFWLISAIALAFIGGADYLFLGSDGGGGSGLGLSVLAAVLFTGVTLGLQAYTANYRLPRAMRLTPTDIEVRTRFGGPIRIPLASARFADSWPHGFGGLRSPNLRAWVGLDPNQYARLRAAANRLPSGTGGARITVEEPMEERFRRLLGSTIRVPTAVMRAAPGFAPTSLVAPVATAGLFFVPGFVGISAFVLWLNDSRPGYFGPEWVVVQIAFGAVFFGGLVWLGGVAMTSYGISLSDEGIVIYDRALRGGTALARTLSWGSLAPPRRQWGGRVWISGDVLGTYLTVEQARRALSDPRCPLRDRLPEDVVRALRG